MWNFQNEVFILNYRWLFNSTYRYERQNELNPLYAVVYKQYSAPQLTCGSKERTVPPKEEDIKSDIDVLNDQKESSDDDNDIESSESSSDSDS